MRYNLMVSAGVLYGGTGVWSMAGANYLDYFALKADPKAANIWVLLVEFGVGLTVASVMVALFFAFAGRLTHIRLVAKTAAHEAADTGKSRGETPHERDRRPLNYYLVIILMMLVFTSSRAAIWSRKWSG